MEVIKHRAVILDLDGTTVDSVESIAYSMNLALADIGMKEHKTDDYKYFAGDGVDVLIERALKANDEYNEENFDKLKKAYSKTFNENKCYKIRCFDGMKESLIALKNRGYKLAVLSNKPDRLANEVISTLYGDDLFDLVRGAIKGVPLKPDITSLNEVCEILNVAKEEVIYVGDTNTDMKTGKNGSCFTVGVLWGFRGVDELEKEGADLILRKPSDLKYLY